MEVKAGYKQTEVGVIPNEWKVSRLSALCAAVLDCHHSTPLWTPSGSIVIRNQNIRDGKLDLSQPSFTDEIHFAERTRRAVPSFGDLVITREAPMGLVCMIPKGLKCCLGQRMVLLRPNHDTTETEYLLYALLSEAVQRSISVVGGTGSTVSNLRIPVLKKLDISAPPLDEQRVIATALSDVDGLLNGLDQLIAKKRNLKQATMQQLLSGQTRLPGFHGEWEVKRLGDVLKVRHGKSQLGITTPDGKYPVLASGGEIGRTNSYIYDKPSVLIGRKGTIDFPQYMDIPFWTVDTLFFSEIGAEADAKFVFYKFTMIRWRSYNEASGVPSLNAKTIENIEVTFPSITEQTAIANVLTDMDGELSALEQRREKTRTLKQAMMQELLTGRTRLV